MVTAASAGPLLHSSGRTAGKSESAPGMGVGSDATVLHGGWVGAGEAVGCNVAVGADLVAGAQALMKTKNIRRGRVLLKFYSPPLAEIPNPAGNLHLVAYLPADAHTAQAFTGLAQQGYGQVTLLESFPVEGYDEFV